MNRTNVRLWIIFSIIVALGVAPFLARGDAQTRTRLETHRQIIQSMTKSQFDHLERNFAAYQKMSDQKVAQLNAFHQEIEKDRAANQGELSVVMNQYTEWLNSIEPFQRDALKIETDPQKRVELIHKIVEDQRRRDAEHFMRSRFSEQEDGFAKAFLMRLREVPSLNPQDLDSLMMGIERLESQKISANDKSRINALDGLERYVELLKVLKKHPLSDSSERQGRPSFVTPQFFAIFENLGRSIQDYVSDENVIAYIQQSEETESKIPASGRVQGMLIKSMLILAISQREEDEIPSLSEIQSHFTSLPVETQNDLLQNFESVDFYKELVAQIEGDRTKPEGAEGDREKAIRAADVMIPFFPEGFFDRRGFGRRPPFSPGRGPGPRDNRDEERREQFPGRPPGERSFGGRDREGGFRGGRFERGRPVPSVRPGESAEN